MANLVYAILLVGLLVLPLPLWSLFELRARRQQQRRGFARLQEAAATRHMILTAQSAGTNGWLAAHARHNMLLLVTGEESEWHTRCINVAPGCACTIQREYGAPSKPGLVSLVIHPPGETPAEWVLYHHETPQPGKLAAAEQLAENWCKAIRKMAGE